MSGVLLFHGKKDCCETARLKNRKKGSSFQKERQYEEKESFPHFFSWKRAVTTFKPLSVLGQGDLEIESIYINY